jgi:hypothetical protein
LVAVDATVRTRFFRNKNGDNVVRFHLKLEIDERLQIGSNKLV